MVFAKPLVTKLRSIDSVHGLVDMVLFVALTWIGHGSTWNTMESSRVLLPRGVLAQSFWVQNDLCTLQVLKDTHITTTFSNHENTISA